MTGSMPAILIHCTTKVLWQTMYWHYRIVHLPLTFSEIYTNRVDSFFFLAAFEYLAFTRWVHLPPLNHTFCKYPSHWLCAALWTLIQLFRLKFARFVKKVGLYLVHFPIKNQSKFMLGVEFFSIACTTVRSLLSWHSRETRRQRGDHVGGDCVWNFTCSCH